MPQNKPAPNKTNDVNTPVKYATPVQRIWAWVGIVYVLLIMGLTTWGIAHGSFIRGIGSLMLSPALAGLGATVIARYRQGQGRGGFAVCFLLSTVSFALSVWNVIRALPVLLVQWKG